MLQYLKIQILQYHKSRAEKSIGREAEDPLSPAAPLLKNRAGHPFLKSYAGSKGGILLLL